MATFQYIKGNRITNALKYELWQDGDSGEFKVATQELLQTFDIPGGISVTGTPHECPQIAIGVLEDSQYAYFTPITKETGEGFTYYVRFKGTMSVRSNGIYFTGVPFDGKMYLDTCDVVHLRFLDAMVVTNGDGIYLQVEVNGNTMSKTVKVYGLGEGTTVELASVEERVDVYSAATGYHRTTYIPIDCLTDDLNGGCVGYYSSYEHELAIYKMCFYDEDFNFLHGVGYSQIHDLLGDAGYLTVNQVKQLAVNEAAKYVIFASQDTDEGTDQVSIGNIYFPLFALGTRVNTTAYKYKVKAIADGVFFTDSEYSNKVPETIS